MGVFDRLRLWNQTRTVVGQVVRESSPAAAERFLRQHPPESGRLALRARSMAEVHPYQALLLAAALARCDAPESIELLRWLTGRQYGWERLGSEVLRDLRRYLVRQGQKDLLDAMRRRLDEGQLAWVLPDVDSDDFLAELARMALTDGVVTAVVQCVDDFVDQAGLLGAITLRGLENASAVAAMLWERGRTADAEDALQLWTLIALASPERFEASGCLRAIAAALPGWIPTSLPQALDGMGEQAQVIASMPARVVRAADLLAEFPRAEWIDPLLQAWLAVDDFVRRDARDAHFERDPMRLMAAQSIAAALGTCAALDPRPQMLVRDEAGRKQLHERLGREIERRDQLVDKHNELVAAYHRGKDVVEDIRKQRDAIRNLDGRIADLRDALRSHLSPAAHLLHVVGDAQSYPVEVRQGAAWGLHRIVEDGSLPAQDHDKARSTLGRVLRGLELDESALRDRLAALLPSGDKRVRNLLVAAERYAADRDAEELSTTVHRLVPEVPSLGRELQDGVDTSLTARGRGELDERILRVLPGARLLELHGALRRGLRWMAELVGGRSGPDPLLEERLPRIAALIGEQLPGVMDFLDRYPLRLMTLHHHREILGQYSRERAHIRFWTRYSPPKWFPGANPGELGQVHRRYLELDDRSMPNALGLYYRLFEHPVLVLPVLYHEFLHFGGPEGDPRHGIANETEVLLREVFFARHLLARLAPEKDRELAAYEADLAAAIERTELIGLARQLFYDFEDDAVLEALNGQIEEIYGEGLDESGAAAAVDDQVQRWNRNIDLENATDEAKLAWCPGVSWPRLDAPENRNLTDRFRSVLLGMLRQDHRLILERRDEVLRETVCRQHRDGWSAYLARPGALAEISLRFAPENLSPILLQVIAQRFQLRDSRASIFEMLRQLHDLAMRSAGEPGQ
ncbi:MAG: hypothetical protein ABUT39_25975 [Acidobacteriota bacterium]